MTPQEQERLLSISMKMLEVACLFHTAAKENKCRQEVIDISNSYCKNIHDMSAFLKDQEASFLKEGI